MPNGIGSIMSIARSAISSHQLAIQTASQNIANAEVDGYHKQRAEEMANYPQRVPEGVIGTGVVTGNITRMQDRLLDDSFRRENTLASGYGTTRDLVGNIEGVFGEPSDHGLANTLDKFWASWSALANAPSDSSAKLSVRQAGTAVTEELHNFAQRLGDIETVTRGELSSKVSAFNEQAHQVADLNIKIAELEGGGKVASDLRDSRDRAIDAMSKLGNVRVLEQANGSVNVVLGSTTVVDGATSKDLAVSGTDPNSVVVKGQTDKLHDMGGSLGATSDALNTTIPTVRAQLDTLASGMVSAVNTLHSTGWTAAAAGTGTNFFDPTGVTAATIDLSSQVKSNAAYIAAGTTVNGAGDNTLALQLAGLRTQKVTIGTTTASINEYYSNLVTDVGFQVNSADNSATVHDTLTLNANTRRKSETGVSVDEELISIMKFQQAYTAASKLVNVADEMAQSILAMVR
ncbi:MAG: flagellar hook-associated protein FlgK [Gemmatimonadota bacterium]|nr:flagellar hook-associated protein FlgK [Gemmatimonadota bacterium]